MRIAAALCLSLVLTGCAVSPTAAPTPEHGLSIRGNVHGGQQPIIGAHVYLFAANTTGYGQPSVSTLSPTAPGAAPDSVGTYVTTDTNGAFTITADYTCTPNTQLYLYTLGGNPGSGINSAAGLLAVLGQCPASGSFASSVPYVTINEVTTIAAAYAMAGFATDATHVSSSGTPLAQTGIANAFTNAANLADISTGTALATTPAGNGTVPQTEINTLANILAACINSTGPSSTTCSTLFTNAQSSGSTGTAATDTATAAINIAHNPTSNITALYALPAANAPFAPTLPGQPNDLVIGITFTGGGINTPQYMAIDAAGSAWISNRLGNSVTKLSSSGDVLSGAGGFTGGGLTEPGSIAVDDSGNAWVTSSSSGGSLVEFSNSGSILSGTNGYTGGGLSYPTQIAIDGAGNAWATCQGNAIVKMSGSGVPLSGASGYQSSGLQWPIAIAIDASGNAWVSTHSTSNIFKLSNSGSFLSGPDGYTVTNVSGASSIAVDALGNVWTAGGGGDLINKISNSGVGLLQVTEDGPQSIAIDGAGNAWTVVVSDTTVRGVSNTGLPISGEFGYNGDVLGDPIFLAIDGSGDIWVLNNYFYTGTGVAELIGVAAPVVTPIATGVKNNTLGTRP